MEENEKIYELKTDLIERNFKFWNSFIIILYSNKIFLRKKWLFGINYEEKYLDINNLDSIYLKKKFNWKPLLIYISIIVITEFFNMPISFPITDYYSFNFFHFLLLFFIILGFIGKKVYVINSINGKIEINFSSVLKYKLDELTEKVFDLKNKSITSNI